MNTLKTLKKISVLAVLSVLFTARAMGIGPALFFSDLTDGPITGWEGSTTKGAAVSIWGKNFGSSRGTSTVTVCGVTLDDDSDFAEWGVVNIPGPGEDPADVYSSARGLERITFWLNSSMNTGSGTITVTTSDGTSNTIPFCCRVLGDNHIYFISRDGNDSYDGLIAVHTGGNNGPWFLASKVRDIGAGDIAYFRAGVWNEDDDWSTVINFQNNNHVSGEENKSITIASYPGEFAQLGDSSRRFVFLHHGSAGDDLHYWTFSKFILRATGSPTNWGSSGGYPGSSSHNRFIGNDFSNFSGGDSCASFQGQTGGQSYFYFYGNHLHDAGVTNRLDRGDSAYGIYFGGYGWHNYIYLGWNEFAYQSNGRGLQLYGHWSTDWMDNVFIHDNYFHHNAKHGAVLGGGDGGGSYEFLRKMYFYNNILAFNGNTDWIEPNTCCSKGCFIQVTLGGEGPGGNGGEYYLYNNVFYQADAREIHLNATPELVSIKNNIIFSAPGRPYYSDEGGYQSIDASNNCYYGGSGGIPSWDQNSIQEGPQFLDPGTHNFQIGSGSPCRDMGTSDVSFIVETDYNNVPRPQGFNYDIGAYESISGEPNLPPIITSLTVEPTTGEAPLTVSFTVTAEDPDGTIENYAWDFGDDGTSDEQNPTHTYTTADTYTATVEVTDDRGAKASDTITISVTDATPPAPPTGLDATTSDGQVDLNWATNTEPDLAGYNVYRSLVSGTGYNKLNTQLITATSYSDTQVVNETTYYYVITAEDSSGNESSYSAEVSATPSSSGNNIFSDLPDFGDADNWTPFTSNYWEVSVDPMSMDKAYYLNDTDRPTSGTEEITVFDGDVFENFKLIARARSPEPATNSYRDYFIIFGYQDTNNYYVVSIIAMESPIANGILKVVDGETTKITPEDAPPSLGLTDQDYHNIEVQRVGNDITVKIDGILTFAETDATFGTGKVGFGSFNDAAYFDDFKVIGQPGKPVHID